MSLINDNRFLEKVAQFVELALDQVNELSHNLSSIKKAEYKVAAEKQLENVKYRAALKLAAEKLYQTDFLTSELEKSTFLKKASEDPTYVVNFLEKVCEASDVAMIGKVARVATKPRNIDMSDPVMKRIYGNTANDSLVDEG